MSTVATFRTDSFLPSGALNHHHHGAHMPYPGLVGSSDSSSVSVISPLALPRGTSGFFDALPIPATSFSASGVHLERANGVGGASQANQVYSPLSPGFRGIPRSQPPQFLSPTLTTTTNHAQYHLQLQPRLASVKTTSIDEAAYSQGNTCHAAVQGAADPIIEHSQKNVIQRLLHQNTRIRDAWEAERKHLEANRSRAEEVYKEEQALMEEDRIAWDAERTQLLQEIESLRREKSEWATEKSALLQQVDGLRQELLSLQQPSRRPNPASRHGSVEPATREPGVRGGVDGSQESREGSFHSAPQNTALVPLQTDMAHNSAFQRSQLPATSSHMAVNTIPGPTSFADAMASPAKEDGGLVPIVDVQEIHPDLEGIPIKALTIQKPTFTDGPSPAGSRSASRTQSPTEAGKPVASRQDSRDQTLQVLAAKETDRLTMHAGHTPSHSLSVIPTAAASGLSTAISSGDRTPTNVSPVQAEIPILSADGAYSNPAFQSAEPSEPAPTANDCVGSKEHPEALLDAPEDPELKGPLMIRNRPAQDEVFLRKLSDKLEEVSKSPEIAVPAVLKDPIASHADVSDATVDGASEHVDEPGKDKTPANEGDDMEIPLKIKKSNNFGAPFGECG